MMDQTHIGYTYWQQPDSNKMPDVIEISNSENSEIGIYIEGHDINSDNLKLPTFDNLNKQNYYFEIYNKGNKPFDFNIEKSADWIKVSNISGKIKNEEIDFEIIPNLGRTSSSVISSPVKRKSIKIDNNSPHLEYDIFAFSKDSAIVKLYFSPTLNFSNNTNGIKYAISFDKESPQVINLTSNPNPPDLNYDNVWNKWVAENINIQVTKHFINKFGKHTLKLWFIDSGIVLQKIVIDFGGLKESYLGPTESRIYKAN